jgi:large subunit ribosomal protein L25
MDQVVDVSVPLKLTGRPEGVKRGGTLHQVFRMLPVKCTPDKIPVSISGDVSALDLNEGISIKDLEVPPGVKINLPQQQTCALVMAPRKVLEDELEEEAAAEAAAEEGKEEGKEGEKGEKGEKAPEGKEGAKETKG